MIWKTHNEYIQNPRIGEKRTVTFFALWPECITEGNVIQGFTTTYYWLCNIEVEQKYINEWGIGLSWENVSIKKL